MSGGSLEGHAGEDPRTYHVHNIHLTLTLCLEDPLRKDPRMYHIHNTSCFNFMSRGSLEGHAGKDPRMYHIHNTSCFNFMSRGSLEGHAGKDPRMYHIHNTLTLCPEDPLRDMLGRIPGCPTYTI